MFEDHLLQKKFVSEQHLHIVIVYGVEKTQPVEPVEPVVRCCSAGTEARDALRNHGFATGRPMGTSGVATEQPDRPSNVPVEPVAPSVRPNDRPKVTKDSYEERQHRPPHRVGHAYALEAQ